MERTEKDLDWIKVKLEELISFRLMLIGASMAVSTIAAIIVTLITLALQK